MNLIAGDVYHADLSNLPPAAQSMSNWVQDFEQAYKSNDAAALATSLVNGIKMMGARIFEFETLVNILKTNPEKGKKLINEIVQKYQNLIPKA